MKKLLILLLLSNFCIIDLYAQVAIGKNSVNTSALLEFSSGTTNGIILPIVETLPSASATQNGTFLMDKNDLQIKMCQNASWVNLSDAGSIANVSFNTTEDSGDGVIIGALSSPATGVLVLESATRAFVLPHVATPETSVKSPIAGMMVYDTASKSVALFDGLKWNYWK